MSLVAGFDFDSHGLHICLLDEDRDLAAYHHRKLPARGDGTQRVRWIRDAMPPRGWWTDHVVAIGIEKPFSRGQGKGSDVMAMALGAILACLPPDLDVLLIRADDWRRACNLPARADRAQHKTNAKRFAAEHWADRPPVFDDNAADAFAIAWATRRLIEARASVAA